MAVARGGSPGRGGMAVARGGSPGLEGVNKTQKGALLCGLTAAKEGASKSLGLDQKARVCTPGYGHTAPPGLQTNRGSNS
jgi:hypothetical protein